MDDLLCESEGLVRDALSAVITKEMNDAYGADLWSVYSCTYTHTHAHTHTHTHTHTHVPLHTHPHTQTHVHTTIHKTVQTCTPFPMLEVLFIFLLYLSKHTITNNND